MENPPNSWSTYQKLVMQELEDTKNYLKSLDKRITKIEIAVGQLKVRSGVWSVIGGSIPVLVMIMILFLKGKF